MNCAHTFIEYQSRDSRYLSSLHTDTNLDQYRELTYYVALNQEGRDKEKLKGAMRCLHAVHVLMFGSHSVLVQEQLVALSTLSSLCYRW